MRNKVIKLSVLSLALATGLIQAPLSYADNCNTPAYKALSKIKNPDVISHINEVNFTSAQKDQFKAMKNKYDTENKKLADAVKATFVSSKQIVTSSTIDEARLDSMASDVGKDISIGQLRLATFKHNLYNLLNDQQKTKYHELQQQEQQSIRMGIECPDLANPDPFDQIKNLNLTAEQKTKIMPLISANQNQTRKTILQFIDSPMSLQQMETQIVQSTSPIDSEKLNAFGNAIAENASEVTKSRLITYHDIYQNLNDQQKTQFMKIISM